MQASVEVLPGLERRLTIGVPAERVDNAVEDRLKETARRARIAGFRPGKVPVSEVRRRYAGAIRDEVLGNVMRDSYLEAVREHRLNPAGNPRIDTRSVEPGKNLEFVATFEIYPEISLPAFASISVEKPEGEVSDADVEEMLETLRRQRATPMEVARAAVLNDVVEVDFVGTREGEPFQGGSATDAKIQLGSGRMIPGFEEGLVGAKAGDVRHLDLVFPADYSSEDLRGRPAQFVVTIKKVLEPVLPELDANFFNGFGIRTDTVDGFRVEVRRNMGREFRAALRNRVKAQVMDQLVQAVNIDLPKSLVTQEIERLRGNMMQQFGGAQVDPSLLPDELFSEQARKSVALGLIVGELVKAEGIRVDSGRVRAQVEEIAESYETPKEVVQWYYANPDQLRQIELSVLEEQVVERVLRDAAVTARPVTYQEAVKASSRA